MLLPELYASVVTVVKASLESSLSLLRAGLPDDDLEAQHMLRHAMSVRTHKCLRTHSCLHARMHMRARACASIICTSACTEQTSVLDLRTDTDAVKRRENELKWLRRHDCELTMPPRLQSTMGRGCNCMMGLWLWQRDSRHRAERPRVPRRAPWLPQPSRQACARTRALIRTRMYSLTC